MQDCKMKTVLVSGASGIVGYGILKSLRLSQKKLILVGTTIYNDSVAEGFCDIFVEAMPTNHPDYIKWIIETVNKYNVDLIIPGIEADLYKWAEYKDVIEKTGTLVLMNDLYLIELCRDKWKFYQHMKRKSLPFLIESSLDNDYEKVSQKLGLPLLIKPRCGYASKGILKVEDIGSFNSIQEKIGAELMVQSYIGTEEEEYTTSAFCDGTGSYLNIMTLRRKLSKEGFTEKAEVVDMKIIDNAIDILCTEFKPIGPTNFQFRMHQGALKLLEINPRISSSTSIRSLFGYNESAMVVDFFLEKKAVQQSIIKKGRAVRYIEELVFYE